MTSRNIARFARTSVLSLVLGSMLTVGASTASAQFGGSRTPPAVIDAMQRQAQLLSRPITVELTDARLEDVFQFVEDFSGAGLEPMYIDDRTSEGLDPEQEISISVQNVRVIDFIDRVLEKASNDFSPATWQFSRDGQTLQIGPRSRLNDEAYLRLYDINDLLFQLPDFEDAPRLDLDQVLNQGGQGGGGSSGSIFEDSSDNEFESLTIEELAQNLMDIITNFVETDQWQANGGDGGRIQFYKGYLLIDAPNYIHQQLGGLPFDFTGPASPVSAAP